MSEAGKTQLFEQHARQGAKMSEFGGYAMPLWYPAGPVREHLAVIRSAGLFDTSHMSELLIEGPDAFALLQAALTKDLQHCFGQNRRIEPGRAAYGFLLNEAGHLIDDAIVMMEDRDTFLLVVNAGMGAPVKRHLRTLGGDMDVAVADLTGKLCKLDLQGPLAGEILARIVKPTRKLRGPFPYFSFAGHYDHLQQGVQSTEGFPLLVSRTGYTGEFGFELFVRPDAVGTLWRQLMEAGERPGMLACGLAARDSLRTGAKLPLSHQDLGDWPARNHPWEFALPWKTPNSFTKSFIGAEALAAAEAAEPTLAFLGSNGRKVEAGAAVCHGDAIIGTVLSCATDMAMDNRDGKCLSVASPEAPEDFKPKGLSCGFVKVDRTLPPGTGLTLKDKRREIQVRTADDLRPDRSARMAWPLT